MKVTKLVSTCDIKDCPAIYATDRGTVLVQGETPIDHGLQLPLTKLSSKSRLN
ncbi:hypothetical protein STBA_46330 [Streptomyces sp. MP131-18]|nr:hypothetical protein STBA_46330 [Streptomyces sp. MP131-18]